MTTHSLGMHGHAPRYTQLPNNPIPEVPAASPNLEGPSAQPSHSGNRSPPDRFSTDNDTEFKFVDQTSTIFWPQISRWAFTALLVCALLGTLRSFESKGNFSSSDKTLFEVIMTTLSLGLGINFFEAFKHLAKVLRWRILARKGHSVREVDLVLGIDDLTKVVVLGWESRAKFWTLFFCVSWISLNLVSPPPPSRSTDALTIPELAQASIALISLNYNVEGGTAWNHTFTRNGIVLAPNLARYCHGPLRCPDRHDVTQALAHAYGETGQTTECGRYNHTSQVLSSKEYSPYFCRRTRHSQEFAYRFSEFNPDDRTGLYPHFTNRTITASSGECFTYVEDGPAKPGPDTNGNMAALNFTITNHSHTDNILIPMANGANDGTTYIYRGTRIPEDAVTWGCGPRCIWMWAHRSVGVGQESAFFQCPITISPVTNTENDDDPRSLSNDVARLAASAIGLQGRWANGGDHGTKSWTQYQFYPFGSAWEIHFKDADEVGAKMAEFAIVSLATMASRSPLVRIEGSVPYLGSRMSIDWQNAILLLAWIVGIHFALFASALYANKFVVIKDDSALSFARLLRPLAENLRSSGTLLRGEQISKAIPGEKGLVYGPRRVKDSDHYQLDIAHDIQVVTAWDGKRHPEGIYI